MIGSVPNVTRHGAERRLTGRMVLLIIVAFFGIVILVNVAMVRAAITTFGGVDTPSSYQAGLTYMSEEAAAAAQNRRNWHVDARIVPDAAGFVIEVDLHDAGGSPIVGAEIDGELAHPVDERRDVPLKIAEVGAGIYRAEAQPAAGQWILDLMVLKKGERLFRSRNRVIVP